MRISFLRDRKLSMADYRWWFDWRSAPGTRISDSSPIGKNLRPDLQNSQWGIRERFRRFLRPNVILSSGANIHN